MANAQTRRNFLRTAPIAAAISLPFANRLLSAETAVGSSANASSAIAQQGAAAAPEPFSLLKAQAIAVDAEALAAKPGNKTLFEAKSLPVNVVLTTETDKAGKEFEWHEGRDHIFQILSGETVYQLGGTPEGGHSTKPGEWLAPTSAGASTMTLKKGDMLVIPRGTPHKRTTKGTVTFTLISTVGSPTP
jgi:quercetin dioxygenase-like cupin family protein